MKNAFLLALLAPLAAAAANPAEPTPDPPHACEACEAWNVPQEPFRIFGDTWYVGTAGLSSILIRSTEGAILIDGGLTQSAPLIAANIRKLGFRVEDIRLIVNSHTHYDHAGGIAYLVRLSHARVAASPASKRALERGGPMEDDPQFAFGVEHNEFPALREVRAIADGETLRVGALAITAHFTPGHTPGGTSWSWRACEGQRCVNVVYADSLNAVAAQGFHFSGTGGAKFGSAGLALDRSIETVAAMPCDLPLAPHPDLIDLAAKLERRKQSPATNPFIDPAGCRNYATAARGRFEHRLADEAAGTEQPPH